MQCLISFYEPPASERLCSESAGDRRARSKVPVRLQFKCSLSQPWLYSAVDNFNSDALGNREATRTIEDEITPCPFARRGLFCLRAFARRRTLGLQEAAPVGEVDARGSFVGTGVAVKLENCVHNCVQEYFVRRIDVFRRSTALPSFFLLAIDLFGVIPSIFTTTQVFACVLLSAKGAAIVGACVCVCCPQRETFFRNVQRRR